MSQSIFIIAVFLLKIIFNMSKLQIFFVPNASFSSKHIISIIGQGSQNMTFVNFRGCPNWKIKAIHPLLTMAQKAVFIVKVTLFFHWFKNKICSLACLILLKNIVKKSYKFPNLKGLQKAKMASFLKTVFFEKLLKYINKYKKLWKFCQISKHL